VDDEQGKQGLSTFRYVWPPTRTQCPIIDASIRPDDSNSALELIRKLLKDTITLDLQQQMVNEQKTLDETSAGKEVQAEITKEREKFQKSLAEAKQQMAEALQARDEETAQAMEELQIEYKERMRKLESASNKLKVTMKRLHKKRSDKISRLEKKEDRHRKRVRRIERKGEKRTSELVREKAAAEKREKDALKALMKLQIQAPPTELPGLPSLGTAAGVSLSSNVKYAFT
jgi:DNA repair exonuclease SbcCD ATPase subunit